MLTNDPVAHDCATISISHVLPTIFTHSGADNGLFPFIILITNLFFQRGDLLFISPDDGRWTVDDCDICVAPLDFTKTTLPFFYTYRTHVPVSLPFWIYDLLFPDFLFSSSFASSIGAGSQGMQKTHHMSMCPTIYFISVITLWFAWFPISYMVLVCFLHSDFHEWIDLWYHTFLRREEVMVMFFLLFPIG